jgi:hypothetical protein
MVALLNTLWLLAVGKVEPKAAAAVVVVALGQEP